MQTSMIISIVLTVVVLILTVITITKGYGFKHSIDPISDNTENEEEKDRTT